MLTSITKRLKQNIMIALWALGALIIESMENPDSSIIGTIKGLRAEKFIFFVRKIKSQAIIVNKANICEALMVMPSNSNDPILSNGRRKAIMNKPALGSLKIASINPMQINPARTTKGEICKSSTATTPAIMHTKMVEIIFVLSFIFKL